VTRPGDDVAPTSKRGNSRESVAKSDGEKGRVISAKGERESSRESAAKSDNKSNIGEGSCPAWSDDNGEGWQTWTGKKNRWHKDDSSQASERSKKVTPHRAASEPGDYGGAP